MVSAGSFILQKGWWVMNNRNFSAPAKLYWYPDLSCPVCGGEVPAAQTLYGGKEKRGAWIDALRESGGCDAVTAAVAEERKEIERYGGDPARQAQYIQPLLNDHVSTYLKSKENGGQTFPDFMGALVLNELPRCEELSAVYMDIRLTNEGCAREFVFTYFGTAW